jgi:predicted ribosome quality control (RQC) complex YloA/Tae2 family protein
MSKIQTTSTVFYYISKELDANLTLGYINNVQTIENDIWKIKIHKQKTKELIITPLICFISNNVFPVTTINGFEKYLKKKLYNQRIKEISQDKNNKVIYFRLDQFYLIFEFFSKSNIILTDLEFKIITSKQKEEWKDRKIIKNEIYKFPSGKDIKKIKKEELLEEIKSFDKKETIRHLSKTYNLAPVEIDMIYTSDVKKLIDDIFSLYNLENPGILYLPEKETYVIKEKGKEIFQTFENNYKEVYEKKEAKIETEKKSKINSVLESQLNKKEEFENKIKLLEKEGEFIYKNFLLIDILNKQITFAIDKKISDKEIISKINNYLKEKQINLELLKIDRKSKKYFLKGE